MYAVVSLMTLFGLTACDPTLDAPTSIDYELVDYSIELNPTNVEELCKELSTNAERSHMAEVGGFAVKGSLVQPFQTDKYLPGQARSFRTDRYDNPNLQLGVFKPAAYPLIRDSEGDLQIISESNIIRYVSDDTELRVWTLDYPRDAVGFRVVVKNPSPNYMPRLPAQKKVDVICKK